jgi:hypothetical protein
VSYIAYAAAVIFAPLAYPGYDWKSRAVSDLSATNAPSLALWHRLSSLYGVAGVVCVTMVCVAVCGKFNKILRIGIYTFAVMFWVSTVGFSMFPLSESGGTGTALTDIVHLYVVLPVVVVLSIVSLVLIMVGGYKGRKFVSLAVCASIALGFMLAGAIGTAIAPLEYFGIFQRFSNLISVNGFVAALGMYLFLGKIEVNHGA